ANGAGERLWADQSGARGGATGGCGADGRRLWQRHGAANGHHRSRLALRRRDRTRHLGMAAGRGSRAAAVSNRSWTTADAAAARTAPADLGQDTRPQPAATPLANDYLARGHLGLALLALCPGEGAAGASRQLAERTARCTAAT